MLLEVYFLVAWFGLALNLRNVVPAHVQTAKHAGKKLIDSSSKWTKNQIRRFTVVKPKKRTKTRTSRTTRTTQYRNLTHSSLHFASGHFNQSNSIFGPQLPDLWQGIPYLPATSSVTDLIVRPSSDIQVYRPPVCPAHSLWYESSTDLAVRAPGIVSVYEPWRLATCLAIFAWPAAQCFSPPQLPPGPTSLLVDDDDLLDWWNPWCIALGIVFWSIVFSIVFSSKNNGKVRIDTRPLWSARCSRLQCRTVFAPVEEV